jgi:hypothetical protein
MAGPLGTGFVERFKNDPNATCTFVEAGETSTATRRRRSSEAGL